jgi:chromosome segregation ATPase
MIATNITGTVSGGANQLLDLLSLVSNPAVYEAKVKALQDLTEEHRKIVELVAPANQITALKAQILADADEAKVALQKAKEHAAGIVAKAQADAQQQVAQAQAQAEDLKAQASADRKQAADALKEAKSAESAAKKAVADAKAKSAVLDAEIAQAKASIAAAQAAESDFKAKAEALRQRAQTFASELQ